MVEGNPRTLWTHGLASALAMLVAVPLAFGADAPAPPARLIVKYRSSDGGTPLARQRLDQLGASAGVRGTRPLFARAALGKEASTLGRARRAADIAARFPLRTARAPRDAALPDLSRIDVLELAPGTDVATVAARYAADPAVEWAEPDRELGVALTPDDPFFASSGTWGQSYPDLWGLHRIDAATAWDVSIGTGTVVAVVDTGIDRNHPDIAANMWTNPGEIPGNGLDDDGNGYVDDVRGWDFANDDADPLDQHGHGTHVAGIVAAVGDNAAGTVGLAFGARVMAVEGLASNGFGATSDLAQAIVYAAENGADVINNSWGGLGRSQTLIDAVATARALGAVVVAAAGNAGNVADEYQPAGLPGVIAVGASDPTDGRAYFSNYGEVLSVMAPGVDVLSLKAATTNLGAIDSLTVAGSYLRLNGTSMAAPHVAALAAVLLGAEPGLTVDEVRWHLESNADRFDYPGYEGQPWNPYFGFGRIDAARVFDPVPITTRLRPTKAVLHEFVGATATDVASVDLSFTTHDPVAWSASPPPWLSPDPAAGTGPATIAVSFDGTGLVAGDTVSTDLAVAAPTAADGGGAMHVDAHVHRDDRVGGEIEIATEADFQVFPPAPSVVRVASTGSAVLAVWTAPFVGDGFRAAILDESGVVQRTFSIAPGYPLEGEFDVASDGEGFLVMWIEPDGDTDSPTDHDPDFVRAQRFTATGDPLDPTPRLVQSVKRNNHHYLLGPQVTYDGTGYRLLWEKRTVSSKGYKVEYHVTAWQDDPSVPVVIRKFKPPRLTDGKQIYVSDRRFRCAPTGCLFAWTALERFASGEYRNGAFVMPVVDGKALKKSARLVFPDVSSLAPLASDGSGFLLTAQRTVRCRDTGLTFIIGPRPPDLCEAHVVASRITAAAVPLDPSGIRLDRTADELGPNRIPSDVVFDGTNYLIAYQAESTRRPGNPVGNYAFLVRVAPNGTVLDAEPEGLLVTTSRTTVGPRVAVTANRRLVLWRDSRFADPVTYDPYYRSVFAQVFEP